ncbi:unnamed protein product [Rotaria socialis]|uniref:Uncharacterized protein n=1 Tax=Rotaria socialis TaxID=392032 RepID=A0A817X478_9BILA|nr:unnamed protein product [Rotaria socialis]CAF4858204.1 unnamed protein product [Rotaria socialis]
MNNTDQYRVPSLIEQARADFEYQKSLSIDLPSHSILLNIFQPLKPYRICPIHRLTSIDHVLFLPEKVKKTKTYSIDTNKIGSEGHVTLIIIELREIEENENCILTFEMLHLPIPYTYLWTMIQKLLKTIFRSQNKFFIWNNNNNRNDLCVLIDHHYLSPDAFYEINMFELQNSSKHWHHRRHEHNEYYSSKSSYHPYKQNGDEWTIEKAINYLFHESIIKFNKNMHNPLYYMNHYVCYCLALTKVSLIIELDWTWEQMAQFKKFYQNTKII